MIKGDLKHEHLRLRSAARKLGGKLEANPHALRGLNIEPMCASNNDFNIRNIGIAGIILAFFVRTLH